MSNMPVFENPCGAYSRYEITKHIPLYRLEEICQAERDGRCMVMPCKVGDTVYYPHAKQILEKIVTGFRTCRRGSGRVDSWFIVNDDIQETFEPSAIGKTIFTTRESVEAALKGATP